MELVIYSPQQDQFLQAIEFNYDELKSELTEGLAKYKGIVYDEASIGEAKTNRANLNKFKDALETRRKEVKKQFLTPYETFEVKIKHLTGMVDEQVSEIDQQVKAFEQAEKDKKRADIMAFYDANIGELRELVPFERIFQERWLNKGEKLASIEISIATTVKKINEDLKTIAELPNEFELVVKDAYLRSFDIGTALNEKTRLEQQKARVAEYEAAKAVQMAHDEKIAHDAVKPAAKDPAVTEQLKQVDFRVWVTYEQLRLLKEFLVGNKIMYGRVE